MAIGALELLHGLLPIHADRVMLAHLGESEAGISKHRRDRHVKLIALEEAFWYDKLATDGTPLSRVPVKPDVVADW